MVRPHDLVVSLEHIDIEDSHHVGKEVATLGEMMRIGLPVTPGVAVMPAAYTAFLNHNRIDTKIEQLLDSTNYDHHNSVSQVAQHITRLIHLSEVPDHLVSAMGYHGHSTDSLKPSWVQHFSPVSILKRQAGSIDHAVGPTVFVRKTLSEFAGRITTMDSHSHDKSKVVIELKSGYKYIVDKRNRTVIPMHPKDKLTVFVKNGIPQEIEDHKLELQHIMELVDISLKAEKHFYFPQVLEWVKDDSQMYVSGIRSATAIAPQVYSATNFYRKPLFVGKPASFGIGVGAVKKVQKGRGIISVKKSDILILPDSDHKSFDFLKNLSGIVAYEQKEVAHLVTAAQRFGIPAVVVNSKMGNILNDGQMISVNGKTGEIFNGGFLIN